MLPINENVNELWDVYDDNRQKTGRVITRGTPLSDGENHLVTICYLVNDAGELLMTKRAPGKAMEGYWECPGGGVLSGEDTLLAAVREAAEEVGVCLSAADGKLFSTVVSDHAFFDNWLFRCNAPLSALALQAEEVCDARWVDKAEFLRMEREDKVLEGIDFFD